MYLRALSVTRHRGEKGWLGRTVADIIEFYRKAYPSPVNIAFIKI